MITHKSILVSKYFCDESEIQYQPIRHFRGFNSLQAVMIEQSGSRLSYLTRVHPDMQSTGICKVGLGLPHQIGGRQ